MAGVLRETRKSGHILWRFLMLARFCRRTDLAIVMIARANHG